MLFVGIDVGGTNIRTALVSGQTIVARTRCLTPAKKGPAPVIAAIAVTIQTVLTTSGRTLTEIAGIGIGVPGPLDSRTGVVSNPPNLVGWQHVPLRALIQQRFPVPVYVGHDAALAGYAEYVYGAGQGIADHVYLTISTGIGGGIIIHDAFVEGVGGSAGEIGHTVIDATQQEARCAAGHGGCLEALASGTALAREARRLITQGQGDGIAQAFHRRQEQEPGGEALGARDVVQAAKNGDREALTLMTTAGTALGYGCLNLMYTLNPGAIILGGGVAMAGELLFRPMHATITAYGSPRSLVQTPILPAALGDDGGLLGAAAYAQYRLVHEQHDA